MATDSTNLPLGETNVDAGTDMTGSDLDAASVQVAQVEGAQPVELPKGKQVVLIPVTPGEVIQLPTDSTDGLLAKIGPEGNLSFVVDGRTIILQGYVQANEQSPVKLVTSDGDPVDATEVVAATDPSLDIQTAAGPAAGAQGNNTDTGSGIFVPFGPGADLGGLNAVGVLGATDLHYKLIDNEHKLFVTEEDTSPDFNISFDVLGGVINEDDLGPDEFQFPQLQEAIAAKFVLGGNNGSNGEGNDPFDTEDREKGSQFSPPDDDNDEDSNANGVDDDREPLQTVATVKVDFHGDAPGSLTVDTSLLPTGLKSEGGEIIYQVIPAGGGFGNAILGFVNGGGDPTKFDSINDRLVFDIQVDKDKSDSEFKVAFTLYDNLDNVAPDSLLGADEQIKDLPLHFTVTDSDGSDRPGTMILGVEDDIPFFGQVNDCFDLTITHTEVNITHDETLGVQPHSNDVSIFKPYVFVLGLELASEVDNAGFKFPFGESEGSTLGAAKTKVHVSFGADGPTTFIPDSTPNTSIRNSVFGALQDKADGTVDDKVGGTGAENEHPFELFMVNGGTEHTPTDADLTIADQETNATVTWDGDADHPLHIFLHQLDAHTVVGYVKAPDGQGTEKVAVMAINIDDEGRLTFYQIHQINHEIDGPTFHDKNDAFTITDPHGNPLIYVRATDYDGDHAIAPVNLAVKDDGPRFCETDWGCDNDATQQHDGIGRIDEDRLPIGNSDHAPGDNKGGIHVDGTVVFNFGTDQPGHLDVNGLTIKDSAGNVIATVKEDGTFDGASNLRTADGHAITIEKSLDTNTGILTWVGKDASDDGVVFTLTLHTTGSDIGEFDFCLEQALQHPFNDQDSQNNGPDTIFEDNLNFNFTVRGFDSDGDWANGHVKIRVDDDSPDACKVEISVDGEDGNNKLVIDETHGKQDGGNSFGDPDASGQDEDDVDGPIHSFDGLNLTALGFAATQINVDLSGGNPSTPDAAYGADGPGVTSPVSIVAAGGGGFDGQKSNLRDTELDQAIFLYTENGLVVGRVGGEQGAIAFALHVDTSTNPAQLELAQYRAIQHDDTGTRDESASLLDCNGHDPIIFLEVSITDADGDKVTVCQPVDGCHGNPGVVFQDDGPTICNTEASIGLAVDESVGGNNTDLNTPEADGDKDGPAIENDEALVTLPAALTGLGTAIGAATADGSVLFHYDAGTDQEKSHTYGLKLDNLDTGLFDTAKHQAIKLSDAGVLDGQQVIEGKNTDGDIIFAIGIDKASGEVSIAQYLAIDHGNEEAAPGAHDELAHLAQGSVFVTLSVTDKDDDTTESYSDISGAVTFDDDAPDVTLGNGTLTLAMDESISLNPFDGDVNDPNYPTGAQDGTAKEPDVLLNAGALLSSGLGLLDLPHLPIGAASGNVAGLFSVDYGSDKAGSTTYALNITALGGLTDLHDTLTGEQIKLVEEGGFIKGVTVGTGDLVFALHIDPSSGDIVSAQYRAIDHGNEETPGAFDEVKFLTAGSLEVVAIATDNDGDSDSESRDISGSISFDDDGPKFIKQIGDDKIDEDKLPDGNNDSAPGDNNGGTTASGAILFDYGTDGPGALSIESLTVKDSANHTIALGDLHTADGQDITISQTGPDVNGIITFAAVVAAGEPDAGAPVFTLTLDGKGANIGAFDFTLSRPLEHPYTDPDSQNNGPQTEYEDNLKFDFTIRGTDGDGDSDIGHIKISIDDDSPVATCDVDCVVEGKDGNDPHTAIGNVVTGADATIFGFDANSLDGNPDHPGADQPYTISKLAHGGATYLLVDNDDGTFHVEKGGVTLPNSGDESFDGKILHIPTHEGGTLDIVLVSGTLSEVGDYKYTVPADADHDHDTTFGPESLAETRSGDFDTAQKWVDAFQADGITLTNLGGTGFAIKNIDVNPKGGFGGSEDYRGIGIAGGIDSGEVDTHQEAMQLAFATPTDNAKVQLGAFFDGTQYDNGFQEVVKWEVFDAANVLVASGQILGTNNGLATLDIDTGGVDFTRLVLTPLNNGAGGSSFDNTDFLLVNVETCCTEDKFQEQFDYTLRDADGDESTACLKVDVKDTQPTVPVDTSGSSVHVDEDGLPGGIGNSDSPHDDITTNSASALGTISFTPGADPVSIELSVGNGGDTGLDTVDGKNVFAAWDAESKTLVGYVEGTNPTVAGNQVFTVHITNEQTGAYEFKLLKPLEHSDLDTENGDNTENILDLNLHIDVQIEDKDCDVAYTSINVVIDDDMPVVNIALKGDAKIVVDETVGLNPGDSNADDEAASPEDDIGYAKVAASLLFTDASLFGADGPQAGGGKAYSLSINLANDSGLDDTQSGKDVLLFNNAGVIEGRTDNAGGDLVFTVSVDAATGEVTVHQYRAVEHDDVNDADESGLSAAGITGGKIALNVAVTDADGDTVSGSVDLGSVIRFEDDGPKADLVKIRVDEEGDGSLVLDETAGNDLGSDDVSGPRAEFTALETAHLLTALQYAATKINVDLRGGGANPDAAYGSDGPGTTELSLTKVGTGGVFNGEQTNLKDTASSEFIFLFTEGDLVVGKHGADVTDATNNGEISFAISIDDAGTLSVAEYRAIQHPISPDNYDEPVTLLDKDGNALVQVSALVTDKDGDHVTVNLPLDGQNGVNGIIFEDDGPKANLTDSVGFLVVDESVDGSDGSDELGSVLDTKDIGYAKGGNGSLFVGIPDFGTDGKGDAAYSLNVNTGIPSGLFDTQTHQEVVFSLNGGVVEGKVAGVTDPVVTISIDPATGEVEVHQYRAVQHGNTSDPDESATPATIASGIIDAVLTVTDRDNDAASNKVDLGHHILFEDDGPKANLIAISLSGGDGNDINLVHDETAGIQNHGNSAGDPGASGVDEDDVAGPLSFAGFETSNSLTGKALGYAASSISVSLTDGVDPNAAYGSDGPGHKDLKLTDALGNAFDGDVTNLRDTETSNFIFLFTEGDVVVGRVGADKASAESGPVAFALSVDGGTGAFDLAQYRAIQHPDDTKADEPVTLLSGIPSTSPVGLVFATVTVTDEDGDSVSKSIPLDGQQGNPGIVFQDDGPSANADVDALDSLGGGQFGASGNVISGAGTNDPVGGKDSGGNDLFDDGSSGEISAIQGAGGTDAIADGSGDFEIDGSFGKLKINRDGTYSYDLDETKIPSIPANGKDVFTYTLIDGDGDTETATLTINLPSVSSPSVAVNLTNDQLVIKEDTSGSFIVTATAGDATDHITQLTFTKLGDLVSAGWGVSVTGVGGTTGSFAAGVFTVTSGGTSAQVQVTLTPPADSDRDVLNDVAADITVTATAEDNTTPGFTANSPAKTVDVDVDAVLDQYLDVSQSAAPTVGESASNQNVLLSLSSALAGGAGNPFTNSFAGGAGADGDGSEILPVTAKITVPNTAIDLSLSAGFPAGTTLVETALNSGIWTLTASSAANLQTALGFVQATVPADFDGAINGTIEVTTKEANTPQGTVPASGNEPDTSDNSYTDKTDFSITVNPSTTVTASAVVGTQGAAFLKEDVYGPIALTAAPGATDHVTEIKLSNIPAGWDVKTGAGDITVTGGTLGTVSLVGGVLTLQITGAADGAAVTATIQTRGAEDSDVDGTGLTVSATAVDGANTANNSSNFNVTVDAILDNYLDVTAGGVAPLAESAGNQVVNLNLSGALAGGSSGNPFTNSGAGGADTDTSEVLPVSAKITVPNLAIDLSLNATGLPGGTTLVESPAGVWTLTATSAATLQTALTKVQATVPGGFDGSISVSVEVETHEANTPQGTVPASGNEPDTTDNSKTDTTAFSITVDPSTTVTTSAVIGVQGASYLKEDVPNLVTLNATPGVTDTVTQVVLSNVPADWNVTGPFTINVGSIVGAPVYNPATHTITFDIAGAPAGTAVSIGVQMTAAPDSDVDGTGLTVSATAVDGANTANNSSNFNVTVDAILDNYLDVTAASISDVNGSGSSQNVLLNLSGALAGGSTGNPFTNSGAGGADTDGSEVLPVSAMITVANTAIDLSLSGGLPGTTTIAETAPNSGVWTLTAANATDLQTALTHVQAVVPGGFNGAVSGTIEVTTHEANTPPTFNNAASGNEPDTSDNSKTDTANFSFTVLNNNVPDANPDSNAVAQGSNTNYQLMLVIDVSGSMGDTVTKPDGTTTTRMELQKAAVVALLQSYVASTTGTVEVKMVKFSNDANYFGGTGASTFLNASNPGDLTTLIAAINGLSPTNNTDYDAALSTAQQGIVDGSWDATSAGTKGLVYFFSDGRPVNDGDDDGDDYEGGDASNTLNDYEEDLWEGRTSDSQFAQGLADKGVVSIAVGLGSDIANDSSALEQLGRVAYYNETFQDNSVIVVNDENQLKNEIIQTVPSSITGNILTNDSGGPDGFGSPKITAASLVVDGDSSLVSTISNATTITIETNNGVLVIDKITGDYTYTAKAGSGGHQDVFNYTIQDAIGPDTDSSTLTINIVSPINVTGTALFTGSAASEFIVGDDADNNIKGGDGNDSIQGGYGNDILGGEGGDDSILGQEGEDHVTGGAGNDNLFGGNGNDTLDGGADNDLLDGGAGDDIVTGGTGNDTLRGAIGDDDLDSGAGNDSVTGGQGNDTLKGGNDDDTYFFVLGDGDDTIVDSAGNDKIVINGGSSGINSFQATRNGNDLVIDYGNNSLTDSITITGHYAGTGAIETLQIIGGDFAGIYAISTDSSSPLDGGSGNDLIAGTSANETLNGNNGHDLLFGGGGNDVIDGGAGADVMVGGDGNDTYTVDNAADLVFEGSGGSSGSADLVNSSLSFTLGNSIENLTLTGAGDIDGTGNGSDNIINGSTGSNTLTGGNGDDTLDGGNDAVADILNGGNDDDTLIWHGSVDTYNGGDDTDTLDVSGVVGSLDFTVLADTTVTRIETIKLTGGSGTAITLDAGDVLDSDDDINPSGGTGGGNTYGGRPVLTVDGDAGSDSVTLSSGGSDTWFSASGAGGVPSGYALYVHVTGGSNPADNEDAYVLVKTGVTVTLN